MKEEFQSGGGGDGDMCVRTHTHVIMYVCVHTHWKSVCVIVFCTNNNHACSQCCSLKNLVLSKL